MRLKKSIIGSLNKSKNENLSKESVHTLFLIFLKLTFPIRPVSPVLDKNHFLMPYPIWETVPIAMERVMLSSSKEISSMCLSINDLRLVLYRKINLSNKLRSLHSFVSNKLKALNTRIMNGECKVLKKE